jgi:adenylate kinase family enzyme
VIPPASRSTPAYRPLLDYYRERGLLAEIDGRGKHEDVMAALLAHLNVR